MIKVFTFIEAVSSGQPFQIGFMLPKSKYYVGQSLELVVANHESALSSAFEITSLWPDSSIKAVTFKGIAHENLDRLCDVWLQSLVKSNVKKRTIFLNETVSTVSVSTALGQIDFTKNKFLAVRFLDVTKSRLAAKLKNEKIEISKTYTTYKCVYDQLNSPLLCEIEQNATLIRPNGEVLNLSLQATIFYKNALIDLNIRVHNPLAIVQKGGKWDLGNESSVYLKAFGIQFNYQGEDLIFKAHKDDQFSQCGSVSMIQFSSGGENWKSENHKDRRNSINIAQQPGKVEAQRVTNESFNYEYKRLEPNIVVKFPELDLQILPLGFWEQFPASVNSSLSCSLIDFAPEQAKLEVELQAGETKAHKIRVLANNTTENALPTLAINSGIVLAKDCLYQSKALAFLQHDAGCETHTLLIEPQKWIAKRETLDEYGWRNFGDIYADHEAAHYTGDGTFVSHYNNQYDPLYGFLKLWLINEDAKYKQLADELFEHIVNIDIYRTTNDKPEYNGGLFWHTDHYVPAETASHRTYSRHQEADVYTDHAGGGGPGPHHCYSSGLALCYLLTGDQQAKETALGLCKWMQYIFEGDNTLVNLIIRIKNANVLKLPFTNKLLLGFGTGVVRDVFSNRYPLDRGTGNYVNVLLDAFTVSHCWKYVVQAEYVILNTISYHDDIKSRCFEDVENTWFYTVFLQAVSKYLFIISQQVNHSKSDAPDLLSEPKQRKKIAAIKLAFLHYVEWMKNNERLYLEVPENLEFANETWTGQDLRKVQILLCGFELSQDEQMREKAKAMKVDIIERLLRSEELSYARIQALIMQNTVNEHAMKGMFSGLRIIDDKLNTADILKQINNSKIYRIVNFIKNYSLKREVELLCVRIPAFRKIIRR